MSALVLNPAMVSALVSALISLIAAACVYPLGRAPDWEDLRPLTWVALSAAAVAGSNAVVTLDVAAELHVWASRAQLFFLSLHVLAWHAYLPGWAKVPVAPVPRALWPLPAIGALALVPGVVFGDEVTLRPLAWLGVVYRDPSITPVGYAVLLLLGAYALWGIVRVVRWGRAGAPYPLGHLICTGTLFAMGLHDAVAVSLHGLPTPYLLDFAYYVPVTFFSVMTLRRISESATQLHRLRSSMETALVDRSRALAESRTALAQAERMAALGQFSAGVAHEVNNPAAAVAASLRYLAGELAGDGREELRLALEDARQGVERIVYLARQLLLAGRTAGRGGPLVPVLLAEALQPALAPARARAHAKDGVALRFSVPSDLWVRAQKASLIQVLTHLVQNAVQGIPDIRSGVVTIRADASGDRVVLVVEDDGVGMSEEELSHVFEPFHGSKPPGMGNGLGLAVARNLVEDMRGTLRFESGVGRGTRALLVLARAEAQAAAAAAGARVGPEGALAPRASILVIDDDPQVRTSLRRLLGRRHDVQTAPGVQEGLAQLAKGPFDLVLCDLMMPAGGGERFWSELLLRAPTLMERVAFMTGGAPSQDARAFLQRQPRPVLIKPFDVSEVEALLAQSAARPAPPPAPAAGERTPTPIPVTRIVKR